jgi:hypothetical protein
MNPAPRFLRLGLLLAGLVLLPGRAAAAAPAATGLRGEPAARARSLEAKAADRYWAGSPAGALRLYQEALRQWHALDDIHGIIRCRTSILGLLGGAADGAVRAEWLRQTREIWDAYQAAAGPAGAGPGADFSRSQTLIQHSVLLAALEAQPADAAGAGAALREARLAANRLPDGEQRRWRLTLDNLEARLRLAEGGTAAAARLLDAPVPAYTELGPDRGAVREAALHHLMAARMSRDRERWAEAAARLETALGGFRLLGQSDWMQTCLEELVAVCRHEGREEAAGKYQLRLDALRRALAP